jgi:hypothetical protein
VCREGDVNDCGGCAVLASRPGDPCGACGHWVCGDDDGRGNTVVCDDPGINACGGCALLTGAVDDVCQVCGRLECSADRERFVCAMPSPHALVEDGFESLAHSEQTWHAEEGLATPAPCGAQCPAAQDDFYALIGDLTIGTPASLTLRETLDLADACRNSLTVSFSWIAFDRNPAQQGGVSRFRLQARKADGQWADVLTLPRSAEEAGWEGVTPLGFDAGDWQSEALPLDNRYLHADFAVRFQVVAGRSAFGIDQVRIVAAVP